MTRLRRIKDYGSAGWKVNLLKQDVEDLGIQDNDLIDIEDSYIISDKLKNLKEEYKNES